MEKVSSPIEKKRIILINSALIGTFLVLIIGSFLYGGLDFAKGTLIGCGIVALNFFSSQRIMKRFLTEKKVPITLLALYVLKLGISVAVLFFAVTKWQIDTLGIMLGLSSLFFSTMISSVLHGKTVRTSE